MGTCKCDPKHYPPFGFRKPRFLDIGYHPKSNAAKPGTFNFPDLYPGKYYKDKGLLITSKGYGWKEILKQEEDARILNHFADHILKARLWDRTIRGPQWIDGAEPEILKGGSMGRAARFKILKEKVMVVPGPGIYGKDHVPSRRMDLRSHNGGFSFSDLPSFEWDGGKPRNLSSDLSYHLPSNIYRQKGSVDELLSRVVSLRGPYDLFTGKRDNSSMYGHCNPGKPCGADQVYDKPGGMEILMHGRNGFKGKFLKCGRDSIATERNIIFDIALCKKNPNDPAANHYDPSEQKCSRDTAYWPFNKSVLHARPPTKIQLKPGPGRFELENRRGILGNGWRCNFLSKTQRSMPVPEKMSWFE